MSMWARCLIVVSVAVGVGTGAGYLIGVRSQSAAELAVDSADSTIVSEPEPVQMSAGVAVDEPENLLEGADTPVPALSNSGPAESAMNWLFGDGMELDSSAMRSVMVMWANRDPAAAQVWLRGHSDHPGAEAFLEGVIESLTPSEPLVAMEWALRHSSADRKARGWASASVPVLLTDPDQAEMLLDQTALGDREKEMVREHWNHAMASGQRNAQNIVSVIGAAKSAGAEYIPDSVESLVEQLTQGITGSGKFSDSVFKISPISPVQLEMVKVFVEVDQAGAATYRPPTN